MYLSSNQTPQVSGATKALVAMSDFGFGSKAKFRCDQRISAFASKADIVLHVHARCRPYVPREQADAIARMEENTLIVQWVQQCLERRISSYRWALERLMIQTPDTSRPMQTA